MASFPNRVRATWGLLPAAAAAAISQMTSTVARLGGRLYWSPSAAIGPSTFVNSDGSGGATPISGLVGLALDQRGGWGFGPEEVSQPLNLLSGWVAAASTILTGVSFSTAGAGGVYFPLRANRVYQVTVTGSSTGSATITTLNPGVSSTEFLPALGTVFIRTNATETNLYIRNSAAGTTTLSQVSVRDAGSVANALTQATTANKPLLVPHTAWANALSFDGNDTMSYGVNHTTTRSPRSLFLAGVFQNSGVENTILRRPAISEFSTYLRIIANDTRFNVLFGQPGFYDSFALSLPGAFANGDRFVTGYTVASTGEFIPYSSSAPATPQTVTAFTFTTPVTSTALQPTGVTQQIYALVDAPATASPTDAAVIQRGLSAIAGLPI